MHLYVPGGETKRILSFKLYVGQTNTYIPIELPSDLEPLSCRGCTSQAGDDMVEIFYLTNWRDQPETVERAICKVLFLLTGDVVETDPGALYLGRCEFPNISGITRTIHIFLTHPK